MYIFDCEDAAAEFIADVKSNDPSDDFIYVIVAHPFQARKFIVAIVAIDDLSLVDIRQRSDHKGAQDSPPREWFGFLLEGAGSKLS
jgi:hypothetical protein